METFLVKKGLYCRPVTCDFVKKISEPFLKTKLPSNCFCQQVQSLPINVEVSTNPVGSLTMVKHNAFIQFFQV